MDFSHGFFREIRVVFLAPQSNTDARLLSSGTSRALLCAHLGDGAEHHTLQTVHRMKCGAAFIARINHRSHTGDRRGSLGNVGGDDELAPWYRKKHSVLIRTRQFTVKRKDCKPLRPKTHHLSDGAFNLFFAGHEDKNIAFTRTVMPRNRLFRRSTSHLVYPNRGKMVDLHGVCPAIRCERNGIEIAQEPIRSDGGGHRNKTQGSASPLRLFQQAESNVSERASLMEFIEHHRSRPRQIRVLFQKTD